jgi:hypothetical protein
MILCEKLGVKFPKSKNEADLNKQDFKLPYSGIVYYSALKFYFPKSKAMSKVEVVFLMTFTIN